MLDNQYFVCYKFYNSYAAGCRPSLRRKDTPVLSGAFLLCRFCVIDNRNLLHYLFSGVNNLFQSFHHITSIKNFVTFRAFITRHVSDNYKTVPEIGYLCFPACLFFAVRQYRSTFHPPCCLTVFIRSVPFFFLFCNAHKFSVCNSLFAF